MITTINTWVKRHHHLWVRWAKIQMAVLFQHQIGSRCMSQCQWQCWKLGPQYQMLLVLMAETLGELMSDSASVSLSINCQSFMIVISTWAIFSSVTPTVDCRLLSSSLRDVLPFWNSTWWSNVIRSMSQNFERVALVSTTYETLQNQCTKVFSHSLKPNMSINSKKLYFEVMQPELSCCIFKFPHFTDFSSVIMFTARHINTQVKHFWPRKSMSCDVTGFQASHHMYYLAGNGIRRN